MKNLINLHDIYNTFDHICGHKVAFRRFQRCDGFCLFEATKYKEFNEKLLWSAPQNESEIFELLLNKLIREEKLKERALISICEKRSGKWIGLFGIKHFQQDIELTLYIHPDYWGSSSVFQAIELILFSLTSTFKKNDIFLRALPENKKIIKMVSFVGFERFKELDHYGENDLGELLEIHVFKFKLPFESRKTKIKNY